jgi:hypothetical protein
MSYARKNSAKVGWSILFLVIVVAVSMWQFYQFATFKGSDVHGGTHHLWWAIAMALLACLGAFVVFSVFVQHDTDDDLHITS